MKNYFSIQKILLLTFALVVSAEITYGQGKIENLRIVWPEEYKWKVGSNQEDGKVHLLELIPRNESINDWTMIGSMLSVKGVQNVNMDTAMNTMLDKAQQMESKAKLTFVEKNDTSKHRWIIFTIESSAESQLFYLIQGEQSFYINIIGIKKSTLNAEFIDKWSKVFKESTFTDKEE